MTRINIFTCFCCLIFLSGCVSTVDFKSGGDTVDIITPQPLELKQVSPDIKLVTAAIIGKMRGINKNVKYTSFDKKGKHHIKEKFTYQGFYLTDLVVTNYSSEKIDRKQSLVTLEGVLRFSEPTSRRAGVIFGAKYKLAKKRITILESAVAPLSPAAPEVVTFFVPVKKLAASAKTLKTYMDYFMFAAENALPMTKGSNVDLPVFADKYLIMTFCLDRLDPQSQLTMKITDKLMGTKKVIAKPIYFNENGWRIMTAGGEFRAGMAKNKFYVQIEYTAQPGVDKKPVKLATYQNRRLPPVSK